MVEAGLGRFGDRRLECTGGALLAAMQSKRTVCVHRLAGDRKQARRFGEFLANPAVTAQEMLANAACLTNRRAAGRHVLAIMDTTDLRFANHQASKRGFGRDANDTCPGLFLHPVLAVDATNGGVIGLVDCVVLNRTEGKVADHKKRAPDSKESRRWLHGAEIAADRLAAAETITMVGDRESDIFDLYAYRPANVHLLCRSAQPRAMTTGGLLPEHCAGLPEQGRETLAVAPKGNQKARQATVALRFDAISLKRPVRAGCKTLPKTLALWVVDVREVDPPAGAEPLHWRLLTTHAVTSLAEARQIVAWYRMRWTIEQVFRSLKIALPAGRGFADGGGRRLHQTGGGRADCCGARHATRAGARWQHRPAARRCGGSRGYPRTAGGQQNTGRADRQAPQSVRSRRARLVRLDRRTPWRMVRLYLARLQTAGAQNHAPRIDPARPDPGRLASGKSFRICRTPVGWGSYGSPGNAE